MKASRITAVGLVAAAALWIASGHFLPHETAESRAAAVRAGQGEAKKPFRVAVNRTWVAPHSRNLILSGRTAKWWCASPSSTANKPCERSALANCCPTSARSRSAMPAISASFEGK